MSCFVDVSRKRYLITSASFAFFFDNFFFVKMRAGGKYIKSPVSLPDITLLLKSLSLDQNLA